MEYEALKEYDDIDVQPTAELRTIKIWRFHFKEEKFTRSVHSGRFNPNRPYEFPIAMIGGDCSFGTPRSTASSNASRCKHHEPDQVHRVHSRYLRKTPCLTCGPEAGPKKVEFRCR
ncbi:hypothetical protein PIB30_075547 [Stylosanthes scabra]|uniref:Uncharacterized protein n=1 Tax=Stylosanthes scabra TaxID=79078 RepID=A0ABU6RPV1_9FABA|nr:hypothetical protein [Stylosanthes scabra]